MSSRKHSNQRKCQFFEASYIFKNIFGKCMGDFFVVSSGSYYIMYVFCGLSLLYNKRYIYKLEY